MRKQTLTLLSVLVAVSLFWQLAAQPHLPLRIVATVRSKLQCHLHRRTTQRNHLRFRRICPLPHDDRLGGGISPNFTLMFNSTCRAAALAKA